MNSKRKWRLFAPVGLVLIGLGFSLAAEAASLKAAGAPTGRWVALGTVGLTVLNSGLSLVAEATKHSVLAELASLDG